MYCCGSERHKLKQGKMNGKKDIVFKVPDMTCPHCKMTIDKAMHNLNGIYNVDIDLSSKKVKVSYDSDNVRSEDIKQAIEDAGYTFE